MSVTNITNGLESGRHLLRTTCVGTLFPEHDRIIFVSKNDTLVVAFQKMIESRILSVPVYDPQKHMFVSFLDMIDVVAFAIGKFSEHELTSCDLDELMDHSKQFRTETCGDISDLSKRNPYCPVESTAPLLIALQLMVKWEVHRIPVIDAEGELITILTQSHAVGFLYQHLSKFEALKKMTVEQLGMECRAVVTVGLTDRALDAFKLMHEKRVSAVAVVDENGSLVGNISVSDLKVIGYDGSLISRLFYPVSCFLKIIPRDKELQLPVTVTPTSTFQEIVSKLVNIRIHRLYIVDGDLKPVGVVSQLDVLKAALSVVQV